MTDGSTACNIFSSIARLKLSQTSRETEDQLRKLLETRPALKRDAESAIVYDYHDVWPLDPGACPGFKYQDNIKTAPVPGTRVLVLKDVSFGIHD